VLPNFEVGDRVKFDAQGKIAISSEALSLRGRSLEGAVLAFAHLRKTDFTGAQLSSAIFSNADLHETKFECGALAGPNPGFLSPGESKDTKCTHLQGAHFSLAQLQGASFPNAQLQGADFMAAQLQGADLSQAQLEGAVLISAHLRGASLRRAQLQGVALLQAQLQGADLNEAQLQGASLFSAQLQGANLDGAQLQGAELGTGQSAHFDARLDGASLRGNYVWRIYPPSNATGALVDRPETGPKYSGLNCTSGECDWSETSYAALKSLIETTVPLAGGQRGWALKQIATLEQPPYVADEASAKAWADLAKESEPSAGSYFNTLAKMFKEIGCAADGAPYVIGALIRQVAENAVLLDRRFEGHRSQEGEVAAAFLEEAKCPGARGLSEENKATLQEIRDRGLPAPPGAGAAAR